MKNTKGFTLIELAIVVVILCILATIAIPRFMKIYASKNETEYVDIKKEKTKFSQDNLYSLEELEKKVEAKNNPEILFNAKLMGEMTCEGFDNKLKVYEFCYKGVKYFAIEGGYMASVMKKTPNPMTIFETCD